MRIAIVNGADIGGGAEIHALNLHRQLRRKGHDSRLIVWQRNLSEDFIHQIPRRRGVPGLKRLTLWLEKQFGWQYLYSPSFRGLPQFIEQVFGGPPDAVHFNSLHGSEGYADLGLLPSLSRRVRTIVSVHDLWLLAGHCGYPGQCQRWRTGCRKCPDLNLYPAIPKDGTRFNFWRKQRLLQRSRITFAPCSEWVAGRMRQSPIFRGASIQTVLNAVDTQGFAPVDKPDAKIAAGIAPGQFVAMFVANSMQNPWKGVQHAINIINSAASESLTALVVGQDATKIKSQLKCAAVCLEYQSDRQRLAQLYNAADVFIFPSSEEAFGLVGAEAMACGTPVIGFNSGGIPEIVGSDGAGVVCDYPDINAAAAAIRRLMNHAGELREMSTRAAERAQKHFCLERQAADFLNLYQNNVLQNNN